MEYSARGSKHKRAHLSRKLCDKPSSSLRRSFFTWVQIFANVNKREYQKRATYQSTQAAIKASKPWMYFDALSGQTLQGSFSAVSKPIIAIKNSLESSFAPLGSQHFSQKSSTFFREWIIEVPFFSFSATNFAFFLRIFYESLSGFRDKFQKRLTGVAFSIKFARR